MVRIGFFEMDTSIFFHWSLWQLLGMSLLILLCACLQGVGGVGFAMVSAPIGALFYPELVPGPLIFLAGILSFLTILREGKSILWKVIPTALIGRAIGTVCAGVLLAGLNTEHLGVIFAILILVAVIFSFFHWSIPSNVFTWTIAGMMSGIMGTLTSAGSSPLALVAQKMRPTTIRATLSMIFLIGTVMAICTLLILHRYSLEQFVLTLFLIPAMAIGFKLSTPIAAKCSKEAMRQLLLWVTGISALILLIHSIY